MTTNQYTFTDIRLALDTYERSSIGYRGKVRIELTPSPDATAITIDIQTTYSTRTERIRIEGEEILGYYTVKNPDYVYRRPAASDYYNDSEPNGPPTLERYGVIGKEPDTFKTQTYTIEHDFYTIKYPEAIAASKLIDFILSDEMPYWIRKDFPERLTTADERMAIAAKKREAEKQEHQQRHAREAKQRAEERQRLYQQILKVSLASLILIVSVVSIWYIIHPHQAQGLAKVIGVNLTATLLFVVPWLGGMVLGMMFMEL